jgi:hypothetical protein
LLTGREIFLICDNLTKFCNDIDDQNFLLATVPTEINCMAINIESFIETLFAYALHLLSFHFYLIQLSNTEQAGDNHVVLLLHSLNE